MAHPFLSLMKPFIVQRGALLRGLLFLAVFRTTSAWAQPIDFPDPGSDPGATSGPPPIAVQAVYSTTGSGPAEFRGRDRGDSGASTYSIRLQGAVPLRPPTWMMPLGLSAQNVEFDALPAAAVPDAAHVLSLNTGVGFRMNEEWMFMARLSPTLYRTSGISSGDVGISGGLIALWRRSPSLTLMMGLLANPDGEFPVLPALGAQWTISPELTLSLMVPRPQIIYRPNERWSFHAGASLDGVTFRTSDTFGNERNEPRYNHALASYRDLRVGSGFEVRIKPKISLQVEGGYSVDRRLDYTRIDERVKFDPAPYFQAGLQLTF